MGVRNKSVIGAHNCDWAEKLARQNETRKKGENTPGSLGMVLVGDKVFSSPSRDSLTKSKPWERDCELAERTFCDTNWEKGFPKLGTDWLGEGY